MARILIVDDDSTIRNALGRLMEAQGHECEYAEDVHSATELLSAKRFHLALSDVLMPSANGIDLAKHVAQDHQDVGLIMLTSVQDSQIGAIANELGAYGYLTKPFRPCEILVMVHNALRRRKLEIERRRYLVQLEEAVERRTVDLRTAVQRLQASEQEIRQSREEIIWRLIRAAEFRDDETAQHLQRMSRYCKLIAERLGMSRDQCESLRLTSMMHDVGKIGIPDAILLKPSGLSPGEFEVMKTHAEKGWQILSGSGADLLTQAASIAYSHHEKFDGSGYPRGLRGEQIPLGGRIAAVADVFDALTSDRVYRAAMPVETVVHMMEGGRGTHFDPTLIDLFIDSLSRVLEIMAIYSDAPDVTEQAACN